MGGNKREVGRFEQISIRLPTEFLKRAEELAAALSEAPAHAHERLTRGAVIRLAISTGLRALEDSLAEDGKGSRG
jgi:predicted DNA-binding protein